MRNHPPYSSDRYRSPDGYIEDDLEQAWNAAIEAVRDEALSKENIGEMYSGEKWKDLVKSTHTFKRAPGIHARTLDRIFIKYKTDEELKHDE